jgi:hypothetical protein
MKRTVSKNPRRQIGTYEEVVYRCAIHGTRKVGSPTASTSLCLRNACDLKRVVRKIMRIE